MATRVMSESWRKEGKTKKETCRTVDERIDKNREEKVTGVVTGLSFMSLIFFEGLFFSSIAFLFSLNCLFKNRMGWM